MSKFLIRSVLALLLLTFLCQMGWGQIKFPVEKYTLDNGMTVLISEDHSAPGVTYQVWRKVGSKNE
ncbi:MAG TPA: insulinase family protein, partial [candidate division Zixibacteria bacterium]